jgi:hypothetical protein
LDFLVWFKRSNLSSAGHQIFDCSPTPGTDESKIYIFDNNFFWKQEIQMLLVYLQINKTKRYFGLVSFVVCLIQHNATASNRIKVYLNGNELQVLILLQVIQI